MGAPEPQAERSRGLRTELLVALLALALYVPGLSWGLPEASAPERHFTFATDELLPLGPLAEMHNTFVASKPDRNYAYPWWHYFAAAAAQAPYLAWLKGAGGLAAPAPEYPYGLRDPVAGLRGLTLAGRALSVLMAVGVALASYRFARTLFGHAAGALAALLTLTNPLVVFYAATGNVDLPALFWTALGLVVAARILEQGLSLRRALALGLWAGVAMATKDQAVVVFLPLGLCLAHPSLARVAGRYARREVLSGLGACLAAYLLCTGMLVDPLRHLVHVQRLLFAPETLTAGALYWPPPPRGLGTALALLWTWLGRLAAATSLPVLLAAAAGLVLAARGAPRRLVLALPAVALFVMVALPMGHAVRRYLLMLLLPIDACAALALLALGRTRLGRPARWPLVALILAWRLCLAGELRHAQLEETRGAAAEWIALHTRPGDRFEYFGHGQGMPHLDASRSSRRIAGRTEWQGEFDHGPRVLAYLRAGGPEYVVVVPDWTSKPGMERSEDCLPEIWQALLDGTAGYDLAARFVRRPLLEGRLPWWRGVRLDSEMVAPPVRIFARRDVLGRPGPSASTPAR